MKTVSEEYAAAHMSELLAHVGAGQEILIVASGRPIARILPVEPSERDEEDTGPEAPSDEVEQAFHGD